MLSFEIETNLVRCIVLEVKEWMVEKFVKTHSLFRIMHQQTGHYVSTVGRNGCGRKDANFLLGFNFMQQLIQCFRTVRCSPEYAFIQNDTDAPQIGRRIVGMFQQNLWRHIQWWSFYHSILFVWCHILGKPTDNSILFTVSVWSEEIYICHVTQNRPLSALRTEI